MDEKKLTIELICAAVRGDKRAQEKILSYYDDYINTLAAVEKRTDAGEPVQYIDEDIKALIQMKLLEATGKWRAVQ